MSDETEALVDIGSALGKLADRLSPAGDVIGHDAFQFDLSRFLTLERPNIRDQFALAYVNGRLSSLYATKGLPKEAYDFADLMMDERHARHYD